MLGAAHARRFRIAPKISPMLGIKTDRTSNSEEEEAKSGELFIHSTQNTVYLVRTFAYTTSTRRNPIQLYRMYIHGIWLLNTHVDILISQQGGSYFPHLSTL